MTDPKTLVERLRSIGASLKEHWNVETPDARIPIAITCRESADCIAALEAESARLRDDLSFAAPPSPSPAEVRKATLLEAANACDLEAIKHERRAAGHTNAAAISSATDKYEGAFGCAAVIRALAEKTP